MAKFQVGEIAILGPMCTDAGDTCEIIAVGPFPRGHHDIRVVGSGIAQAGPGYDDYIIKCSSGYWYTPEFTLIKKPPDSHADDTTEDPGVTRLKKLLQQDTAKTVQKVKA